MTDSGLNPMLKFETRNTKPSVGRLVLEASTGMHGEVSKKIALELVGLTQQVQELFLIGMRRTDECERLCNAMDALLYVSENCGEAQYLGDSPDAWDAARYVLASVRATK